MSGQTIDSGALLGSLQFRQIITYLRNGGKRISAAWLVWKIQQGTTKEAIDYVNGCHVVSTPDGWREEPNAESEAPSE